MKTIVRAAIIAATFAACSSDESNDSRGNHAAGGAGASMSSGGGAGAAGFPGSGGASGAGISGTSGSGGTGGEAGTSGNVAGTGGQSGTSAGAADGGTGAAEGGSTTGSSAGCGTAITRPNSNVQQMMDVGGMARTYLLDVPAAADNHSPLTLIFALHGANMTNTQVFGSFNFGTRSNGKAITVYPQGDQTASGSRWTSNETNWTYIQMLMTDLENRYCIDQSKVFLTGFSMGGGFTMDTACQKSTMFRAFATVEGYGPGGVGAATKPTCTNANAKAPLLIIQGTTDGTVTPEMGQASLAFWTEKNGCSATTTMPMGPGFTSCTANDACTSTFPVYYCTGDWNHAITSTAVGDVWAFFSSFQ